MSKKWFVHSGSKREGPFTPDEVQRRLAKGEITPDHQLWTEGMQGWKKASEIGHLLGGGSASRSAGGDDLSIFMEVRTQEIDDSTSAIDRSKLVKAEREAGKASRMAERAEEDFQIRAPGAGPWPKIRRILRYAAIVGAVGGAAWLGYGYFQGRWTMADALAGARSVLDFFVSPIPAIEGLSPELHGELKKASRARPGSGSPIAAVAFVASSDSQGTAYVAANVPDGTALELYLHGIPGALLERPQPDQRLPVSVVRRFAKVAFRSPPGSVWVKGDYQLVAAAVPTQTEAIAARLKEISETVRRPAYIPRDRKVLASRVVFLGGKKDDAYLTKLKDHHVRVKAAALASVKELQGVLKSLHASLSSTVRDASSAMGKPPKLRPKAWAPAHGQWSNAFGAVAERVDARAGAVGGYRDPQETLWVHAQAASRVIRELHQLQHAYITGAAPREAYDARASKLLDQANAALGDLQNRLDGAERRIAQTDGFPSEDGS
jgi:hypothetical protein